jgi:hypothetical protein
MTIPNLFFWLCLFSIAAALLLFTTVSTVLHPFAFVLAAAVVSVVHQHG